MVSVTVLIPTLGRVPQLEAALTSIARGNRAPDAVVLVTQGEHAAVDSLAARFPSLSPRVIHDGGRGRGRGLNRGLAAIDGGVVLVTDDDCRVREDWVQRGHDAVTSAAEPVIVAGRVLTEGDLSRVPALRLDPLPHDYRGRDGFGQLTGSNLAFLHADLMTLGGFDETIVPGSEDNELGWRWLKAGHLVRYDPQLVIWHDDWRTPEQLRHVFRSYGTGQGRLYAKHLREGDRDVAYFVLREAWAGARLVGRSLRAGRSPAADPRAPFYPALVRGLLRPPPPRPASGADRPVGLQRTPPPLADADRPVGVVIVTRDRAPQVLEAVASVRRQTVRTQVMVMDDASTDGTADLLAESFPEVRVVRTEKPTGPCVLRNRAVAALGTDLVLILDDDAYLTSPHTLAGAVREFADPRVAVAGIPFRNARRDLALRQQAPSAACAWSTGVFVGVCALIRRRPFLEVEGFDERAPIRGEEGDLALRLVAAGHAVVLARTDPVVHWEADPTKSRDSHRLTARNEVLLTWLHVPATRLPLRLLTVGLVELRRGFLSRRLPSVLTGLREGVAACRRHRLEREPVSLPAYDAVRRLRRGGPVPLD